MTWWLKLSLILVSFPAIFARSILTEPIEEDSNWHQLIMDTAIGQKVMNAAREAKFEAELVGLVVRKDFACKHVVYDMADWLTGKSFEKNVDDLLGVKDAPKHISRYNMRKAYLTALEHHKIVMKQAYHEMKSRLHEWNTNTVVTFAAGISFSPPISILKKFRIFEILEAGPVEVDHETFHAFEFMGFENDLRDLSNELMMEFQRILNAMKSGRISYDLFNHVKGDIKFETLAQRILDGEYNGSFVEEFGYRIAHLQTIKVVGYKGESIVTKVCMTKGVTKNAHALFKIVPHGSLTNRTYTKPSLPEYYAAEKSFEKLDDLYVVKGLPFFQDERAIAEAFGPQSSRCRLTDTSSCLKEVIDITRHGGTILNPLGKSTLIVTTEEAGVCIDENGHFLKYVAMESPIYRHKHANCLLRIGDEIIGDQTVDLRFIPKNFEGFLPNNGEIGPLAAWINDNALILGGVSSLIVTVLVILLIVYVKKISSD